jgi:hypothetical protein
VWLRDGAGNADHNNRAETILRYDSTPPSGPTVFTSTTHIAGVWSRVGVERGPHPVRHAMEYVVKLTWRGCREEPHAEHHYCGAHEAHDCILYFSSSNTAFTVPLRMARSRAAWSFSF